MATTYNVPLGPAVRSITGVEVMPISGDYLAAAVGVAGSLA